MLINKIKETPNLTIPIKAFVTFEQEEGFNLMKKKKKLKFGNSIVKMREADEPSNIQWENLDSTSNLKFWGFLRIMAIMVVLFSLSIVLDYSTDQVSM